MKLIKIALRPFTKIVLGILELEQAEAGVIDWEMRHTLMYCTLCAGFFLTIFCFAVIMFSL